MDPLLDIVVLVHDKAAWAELCIRSVESFTKNPYRLIVVDSASVEQESKDLFEACKSEGHTVIHLAENRSFSNGVNAGVNAGTAPFVCVLNDDAIVTEGWDGALLQDASDKFTGLVGARSNYASGAQGDPSFIGEPPFLVFVCVALRREVWNIVGPMDEETFDGFSSEDLDYSWRVKKAGYKLKVSSAFVLHAGSRTIMSKIDKHGPLASAAYQRMNAKYNGRLIEKWGKEWAAEHSRMTGRGLVTSYHGEEMTRVGFMRSLFGLKKADIPFEYLNVCRAPIQMARQLAADFALDNGFDWWVQFDDDATFPEDVLRRLLSHQKDVVCALAYQRKPPYGTCAFETDAGGLGSPLEGIEHTGLRKVDVSGFHCSIIRTSVIKKLRDGLKDTEGNVVVPGIRQYFGGFDNKVGEDFAFCLNLKKLGIQVHVDTDLIAGHIGSEIVVDEAFKADWIARGRPM